MPDNLVRFRASPTKIRVSIRKASNGRWAASVSPRNRDDVLFWAQDRDPAKAVDRALERASEAELDGVDLGCGWAYAHPQQPG